MGSERVFGGVGARELDAVRESEWTPVDKSKSQIQRDGTSDVAGPKSASWGYLSSASYKRQGSHSLKLKVESVTEHVSFSQGSPIMLGSSRSNDLQLSSKCKKLSKNGSGSSKRPRLVQMEDSHNPDKCQIRKQKENFAGKRTDKRTAKVSTRAKYDSFSPKNGLGIFNSSSGGHKLLGYYGLKPDIHDIAKQVNELTLTEHSLEELLDDTFTRQDIGKSRENELAYKNGKIEQSIRNVCSILLSHRPSQLPSSYDLEGNLIKTVSVGISSASCAPGTGSAVHDKRDSTVIDQLAQNKEPCSCPESPANTLDFQLYHPSVVLERLGLRSAENLDSLLACDVRPILSASDGFDARLGKRLATQPYLPAFSWSHTFGGHCKSASDALKLSTSRSLCQGSRWAKIEHTASIRGVVSNDFTDFTKFSFNANLVPQGELVSVNLTSGEAGHLPDPTLAASDSRTAYNKLDEHPPGLTVTAQTLCELSTQSLPPDLRQLLRRPRKPQDNAPKQNYEYKSERLFSRPKSLLGYDSMARRTNHTVPAKKIKLTSTDKKKDATPMNEMAKGPLIWSSPKSCRSSSHRSIKDTKSESKYRSSDLSKPTMGLPPVRMLHRGSNSQQKPRKVLQVYWDR